VYTVNIPQLASHIAVSSLPQRLGGISDRSHAVWVSQCLQSLWHKSAIDDDDIVAYVAPIVARPSLADTTRHSISSTSPDAVWDAETLDATFARLDLDWDGPPSSSSVDLNSPFWLSRKRSVDGSPAASREMSGGCSSPADAVILLSPPLPKCRLSSNSAGESIHGPDSGGLTINELVDYIRDKGQHGLVKEYKLLKEEEPAGTFEASRYVLAITFMCELFCAIYCRKMCHTLQSQLYRIHIYYWLPNLLLVWES